MIDKMRTQQILINLVSNAIKFSRVGDEIIIQICDPVQVDPETDTWGFKIKVTDQGIGLNDEDRSKLFKPYFKSSCRSNRDANPSSNGLGLSNCKRLAKILSGDLTLSETYKKGCEFILKLNLQKVDLRKRKSDFNFRGRMFGRKKPRRPKHNFGIKAI